MARVKAKSIDRNRLVKRYPFIRAPKRMTFMADSDLIIELIVLEFNDEESKRGEFQLPYQDTNYRVAISPRDTGSDSSQVNIAVDDDLSDTAGITVNASAKFTGKVDVLIIRIDE